MYPVFDQEQKRKQLKARYNRRFFFGAHIVVYLLLIILSWTLPILSTLATITVLLLIPHALYVIYKEYRYWMVKRVDQELSGESSATDPLAKRKRYPQAAEATSFNRLMDTDEYEQVDDYDDKRKNYPADEKRKKYADDKKSERLKDKSSKKRRKKRRKFELDLDFDTDEFDVKKLMKKLKDIVD